MILQLSYAEITALTKRGQLTANLVSTLDSWHSYRSCCH